MENKVYKIPVKWMMSGTYYVRASSLEVAKEAVFDVLLPNGEYVDDSFSIDENERVKEVIDFDPKDVIEVQGPWAEIIDTRLQA